MKIFSPHSLIDHDPLGIRRTLFAILLLFACATEAGAARRLPDDYLGYPVLVTLKNGATGSGFYLKTPLATYFVTAKHVLFAPSGRLWEESAELASYPRDPKDQNRIVMRLDLKALEKVKRVAAHPTQDIAVVKIGTPQQGDPNLLSLLKEVQLVSVGTGGIVTVGIENIKQFSDVFVANDIFTFGYPGLDMTLLDSKPLLRAGIVSSKIDGFKTMILDSQVFPGHSGGPVLEIDDDGLKRNLHVVGVISRSIPVEENRANKTVSVNSGYTLAVPMDFVLESINEFERTGGR